MRILRGVFACALLLLGLHSPLLAQSPSPAGIAPADKNGGFTPGWTLGTRFEGSMSSDGSVFDLGTAVGRNFSRHLGVDFGIPFYFIGTPAPIKTNNPDAVSGIGIGSVFSDLRLNYLSLALNYATGLHLGFPTGDTSKGLSAGHVTWNLSNHFDHTFGDFSPFLNAGVGNTILDTRYFHRPFSSYGYNAAFEGGLEYDPGKFSFSASAYDIMPWGTQTIYSRVFRCGKSAKCSPGGPTSNRKNYLNASVSTGPADLVRDNGFSAGVDFKPTSHLDLEFDLSHSVPLQLNSYSFGVGVDLSWFLQKQQKPAH